MLKVSDVWLILTLLLPFIPLFLVAALNNGLGLTPPMGWRSWNCYGGNVNQTKMTVTMDRMTARTRKVNGKLKSLLDLG